MRTKEPLLLHGLLAFGAVLTALTLIFPQIGFLEWISMIPVCVAVFRLCKTDGVSLWKAYRYGFFTVFCFYFIVYHWFVSMYPLDFAGLEGAAGVAVIAAAWIGLSILRASVGGLMFLWLRLLDRCGIFRRAPILRPFAFAALWSVFEWAATLNFAGVPWGRLALGQIRLLPMLGISSWFGSYFVSFLLVSVGGLLAEAFFGNRKKVLCLSLSVGIIAGNLLFGLIWQKIDVKTGKTVRVAAIQANISSTEKWISTAQERQIYADLTRAAAEDGAQIIVWPETALPYELNLVPQSQEFLSDLARETGVTLFVGALRTDDADNLYNSIFMISPEGEISAVTYDKRHLVPFGEYVPLRKLVMTLIPPLSEVSMLDEDLEPGKDSQVFETEYGGVGALICFDSIYEDLAIRSVRDGAELLILSTNDSWFYDSAAVYQHEAQAKLRSIETGRDMIRAANTGISVLIDNRGEAEGELPPLQQGYSIGTVTFRSARTLYSYIGNLFVYLCLAGLILPVPICIVKKKMTRSD